VLGHERAKKVPEAQGRAEAERQWYPVPGVLHTCSEQQPKLQDSHAEAHQVRQARRRAAAAASFVSTTAALELCLRPVKQHGQQLYENSCWPCRGHGSG